MGRQRARDSEFERLDELLRRVPGVGGSIGSGRFENGLWWVKFKIDTGHPQAWHVVQWLGHVMNYVAISSRLPTVFMPVSPPPYLNGGPATLLSWVIESKDVDYTPDECAADFEATFPYRADVAWCWVEDEPDLKGAARVRQWVRRRWRDWRVRM